MKQALINAYVMGKSIPAISKRYGILEDEVMDFVKGACCRVYPNFKYWKKELRKGPFGARDRNILKLCLKNKKPVEYIAILLQREVRDVQRQRSSLGKKSKPQEVEAPKPKLPKEDAREFGDIPMTEDLVHAYRFLYYVKNISIISDKDYDALEREVIEFDGVPQNSAIFKPGSDNKEDYPDHIRSLALYLALKKS